MTEAKEEIIEASTHSLRTYVLNAVASGHFRENLGEECTMDGLQRLLHKDGFGPQSKNFKELGQALAIAGVTQTRKSVAGKKIRMYKLPHRVLTNAHPDLLV
jgi:hypothetical protein